MYYSYINVHILSSIILVLSHLYILMFSHLFTLNTLNPSPYSI